MTPIKLANPIYVTKGAFGLAGTAVGVAGTVARGTVRLALAGLHELTDPDAPDPTAEHAAPTREAAAPGPTVVVAEPRPPEGPVIDVVGQALATEAELGEGQTSDGAGMAHEPRGASRDEEHGDAALQRAEVDEIDDEVAAAVEGDIDAEEHLTEPLLDPATVKALASDARTMSRAADPEKG